MIERVSCWTVCAALLACGSAAAQVQADDVLVNLFTTRAAVEHYAPDGTLVATTGGGGTGDFWVGASVTLSGLFVTTRRAPAPGINLFWIDGTQVATFDTPDVGAPGDVSVFADGTLAICDNFDTVSLYSETGTFLQTLSAPGLAGTFGSTIDASDELWVGSTTGNGSIWHFARDGTFLGSFSTGQWPSDLVAAPDGTLWVVRRLGDVRHYDRSGNLLSSFATGLSGSHWGIGLASDGTLYVTTENGGAVFHFDPLGNPLGQFPLGPGARPLFLTVTRECTTPAVAYCTAKVNSLGCVPTISSKGLPSASASAGFFVRASDVRDGKVGLLLYSLSGAAATPFQGGTLCLAPPIRRTPPRDSGGPPVAGANCGGLWRLDMNAFAAGAAGGAPHPDLRTPGTVVRCQWWGRDPGAAFGSTLTDALHYAIAP